MLIVDAQVHFWATPPSPGWRNTPHLQQPSYTPADLLPEMDKAGVDAALLVPTNFDKGDLVFGLLFFCVMCPLEMYYNTWYWYAPFVTVLMKDRRDMEFIDPLLQPGNSKK